MKTVLIAAFLSALCSEPSIAVKDTKLCLTWNATDASLFLKCKVLRLDYKLVLMDAFNIIRVECFKNRTPFCATSREDDMFFVNLTDGFSLVLQTDKKNGDGNWQCIHGHNEDHVNISSSKGTIYSTDLHLSGEIIETKEYKKFNLTCFSCWIPHMRSVYFFVNGVLEDNLQVSGGKCYNKREMCNLTECTCSMEGNDFTWSYTSDLSYLEFSCEMRFKDLETLQLSFETAHLIYNETGFNHEVKRTRIVAASDKYKYISSGSPEENENDSACLANCRKNRDTVFVFVCTLMMTVGICTVILSCVFPDIPGRLKQLIFCCYRRIQDEKGNNRIKKRDACSTCNDFSVCGICVDCKKFYCNTCCKYHLKEHSNHRVCQIQNVSNRQLKLICKTCVKLAKKICGKCWELSCTVCAKGHKHGEDEQIMIYQAPLELKQHMSVETIEKLDHQVNMPIENDHYEVRISGICYLEDKTLVAVDRNNQKLIIFKAESQLKKELKEEPCAMTAMTGDKIAVTFPYQMQIRIFEINLKTTDNIDGELKHKDQINIDSYNFGKLKPFSIAYHNKHFAVEVGEGEDGMIMIILDDNEKTFFTKIECNFAYFTGHTIRLALNINDTITHDSRLFVSAMSSKIVSCMNFEGKELWHKSIPSPRSIIALNDCSLDAHIIISSRRCNAIYELTKKLEQNKEERESLKARYKISSPRYMAYHENDKMLCVVVENDLCEKDELAVFKFNDQEPIEETNLLEEDTQV